MKISVYNSAGTKSTEQINSKLFDGEINPKLISEVVYITQSNLRQAPAKTLDRGEVAGSGIKPWRQKGTGRARAGSKRSPIWRGGGVTFGPTGEQNFSKGLPTKKNQAALVSALASKKAEEILILKGIKLDKPSTKVMAELLNKLGAFRDVLIITDAWDEILKKSVSNLPEVALKTWTSLNVLEVLKAEKMIFIGDSLEKLAKKLDVKAKKDLKETAVKKPEIRAVKGSSDANHDVKKVGTTKKSEKGAK